MITKTEENSAQTPFRSGFVTIVGSPNVGKSTLLNALVGQKVAIVSDKAQTTRSRIRGIVNLPGAQMVLIDTPGIQAPRNRLGQYMLHTSYDSMRDGDGILMLLDPINGLRQRDEDILARLQKEEWLTAVLTISAQTSQGLEELLGALSSFLLPGPRFFPEDMVTDQPERVLCAEFIREACLQMMREEIPHGIAAEIDKIEPRSDRELIDVWATVFCEREAHKRILIGSKGSMLKKIGSTSRRQMEWLFASRVNLQLWVKVKENWRDNSRELYSLGYHQE